MNATRTTTKIFTFDNMRKDQKVNSTLVEIVLNDPESKMRVGIKETEEMVKDETKKRNLNAPTTTEERIFLKS